MSLSKTVPTSTHWGSLNTSSCFMLLCRNPSCKAVGALNENRGKFSHKLLLFLFYIKVNRHLRIYISLSTVPVIRPVPTIIYSVPLPKSLFGGFILFCIRTLIRNPHRNIYSGSVFFLICTYLKIIPQKC